MTVYLSDNRERWTYDFWYLGTRHQGYCLDTTGLPVTSKTAAKQAELDIRRLTAVTTKYTRAHMVTIAQVVADLQPRWLHTPSWDDKKRQLREIVEFFGPSAAVREIDESRVREYTDFALTRPRKIWKGGCMLDRDNSNHARYWKTLRGKRAPSTVNRYLSVLRQILKRALELRDPITRQPVIETLPVRILRKENGARARYRSRFLLRLLEILPQHAVDAVVLTLFFGFRKGEAFGLQEKNIDWLAEGVRLFAEDVKDKEDTFLPGSQEAMGYLRCLAMEAGRRGVRHLLTHRQSDKESWRPLKHVRSAWDRAMDMIEKELAADGAGTIYEPPTSHMSLSLVAPLRPKPWRDTATSIQRGLILMLLTK